jgi:hypothetical protein|tara:strand:+ start:735 stop:959 length:225 start_codon:yes stop_codon:yes gene_type:complete
MNEEFERFIIITLILILVGLGLSGCAKPKIDADKEPVTMLDSIGNMEGIAEALGCVFAPTDEACDKPPQELHTK